jgi:hypothetical protein
MKKKHHQPWNAEQHRRFAETCFFGLAQMLTAAAKPLMAIAVIAAILTVQPAKLLQLLISFR